MFETAKVVLILFSVLANFLIGLISLAKNPGNTLNRSIAIFAWVFSVWSLSLFFYDYPVIFSSLIWIKITYSIVVFGIIGCLYYFAYIFPEGKNWPPLLGQISFFISAILLTGVIFFSDFFIQSVTKKSWGYETTLGFLYIAFNVFASIYGFGGLVVLIKKYRKALGYQKNQLKYMFLGLAFFVFSVLILDSIIPLLTKNSRFFSISTTTSLFFVGFTTYAIIVHRLMDIRLVVARSIAYALLLFILGTFYIAGMFLASTYFIKQETNITNLSVSTILALFMAFTFQPLKTILERLTDKIFFKGNYDTQELLSKLGLIMNSYIDLELLNRRVLETIIKEVRIATGAFIVFGEDSSAIYNIIEIGFNNRFVMSFLEASSFFHLPETTAFDDLEEGGVKNMMRERGIALVKVLKVKDKIIGLLVLGGKSSGGVYSSQDLKFLDIISPEVAVAIQNSLSYDKIKKFNFILSQEVQKATSDLKRANERLKSLDELKDDFVSIASHELRTPMTAIRSYAWMALHRSDMALNEKMEKYLIRVLMSTERLINLVNDMLNISRIEAGKIEINPEPVDPIALCRDIIDEVYYSKSVDKKINFVLLEKAVPKIFADPDKLRQVLLNLVGNALKFTPAQGSITLDFFTDGKTVEISVKDTGTGISKDDIGRLFQKFSRLDNSYVAAATSGGTGLGLYISRKIIELMHGTIRAYSQGQGTGSTFTFSLPVASREVLQHAKEYTIKPPGEIKGLEPAVI